jgi:hypothetical protein
VTASFRFHSRFSILSPCAREACNDAASNRRH